MGCKQYQTVDSPKESPRLVVDCLVSIYKFFTSNFNFPNPQIFNNSYFPQFYLSVLRKIISFLKCPKTTQKFTQNRQTVVMVISIEIWRCLKRERDIGRKVMLRDVKTAFTCTPALIVNERANEGDIKEQTE